MQTTSIAVLGGTGRVGRLVVTELVDRGVPVSALVRPGSALPAPVRTGVRVHTGQVDDRASVAATLDGCAAVVVAVGVRYRGGNPWRGIDGPVDVVPTTIRSVLAASPDTLPVVLLSAFGAGESWDQLPWIARAVIRSSALAVSYRGLTAAEDLLGDSGRPHVTVRSVTMVDGPATGGSADATGTRLRGNPKVTRGDVARLLAVQALDLAQRADQPSRVVVAAAPR